MSGFKLMVDASCIAGCDCKARRPSAEAIPVVSCGNANSTSPAGVAAAQKQNRDNAADSTPVIRPDQAGVAIPDFQGAQDDPQRNSDALEDQRTVVPPNPKLF